MMDFQTAPPPPPPPSPLSGIVRISDFPSHGHPPCLAKPHATLFLSRVKIINLLLLELFITINVNTKTYKLLIKPKSSINRIVKMPISHNNNFSK
jgi:hypothetical protein